MCGLAGLVDFSAPPMARWSAAVESMAAAIAHRGPDGWGRVEIDREAIRETSARGVHTTARARAGGATAALAHARLAIIDLSPGGHQPMPAGEGWLVYNGEIYNHRSLRDRFAAGRVPLRSTSDTEVLARLLAEDGPAALRDVRGMFALAWWDEHRQRLVLARDRFGIKPLVFARPAPGAFAFASEPRALAGAALVQTSADADRVAGFLARGSVDVSKGYWPGVETVPPGAYLVVDATGVTRHDYWSLESVALQPADTVSPRHAAAALRESLIGSVEAHLVSDVPVAIFLSGGLDSTALLAAAREVTSQPVQTFTVSMPGGGLDESAAARAIAARFGSDHLEVTLDRLDIDAALDEFFAAMQVPSVDGFNTFLVARAARQAGVRVALSGVGGDELLGGYDSFAGVPRLAAALKALGPLARALGPGLRLARQGRASKLADVIAAAPRALPEIWWEYRRLLAERDVIALTGKASPQPPLTGDGDVDAFSWVRYLETRFYLEPQLLGDADAFTMCGALELRTPLVDHLVLERLAAVGHWPRDRGRSFKQTLFQYLPDLTMAGAVERAKQGFVLPFDDWIRSALTEASPPRLRDVAARLRRPAYAPFVRRFLERRLHWSRLWAIYVHDRFDEVRG